MEIFLIIFTSNRKHAAAHLHRWKVFLRSVCSQRTIVMRLRQIPSPHNQTKHSKIVAIDMKTEKQNQKQKTKEYEKRFHRFFPSL